MSSKEPPGVLTELLVTLECIVDQDKTIDEVVRELDNVSLCTSCIMRTEFHGKTLEVSWTQSYADIIKRYNEVAQ